MLLRDKQGNILILTEYTGNEIDSLTFQITGKGRELANMLGCKLDALIIGYKLDLQISQLQEAGFDSIYIVDNQLCAHYNTEVYLRVISEFINKYAPDIFMLGYTYLGMEIGPAIAVRQGINLVSNCTDIKLVDDKVIVTRPMFNGVIYTDLEVQKIPFAISLQQSNSINHEIIKKNKPSLLPVNIDIDVNTVRTKIIDFISESYSENDITKSDILVALGRGIGNESVIPLAHELANLLHGAVACSRPLADLNWLPPDVHVGISGKTVHPKVYIACGISGASQHIAGMSDSHVIIAINKDPDAPIFRIANYGIVRDLSEVIPALISALKDNG